MSGAKSSFRRASMSPRWNAAYPSRNRCSFGCAIRLPFPWAPVPRTGPAYASLRMPRKPVGRRAPISSGSRASEGDGVRLLKRKPRTFDIQVQDVVLHITARTDLDEESRAAALSFWEQLEAYALRNPD